MLSPSGNFGKFLTVLMALSVTANVAPTLYSFCLSFQVFMPFLAVVPRYVFSIVATAMYARCLFLCTPGHLQDDFPTVLYLSLSLARQNSTTHSRISLASSAIGRVPTPLSSSLNTSSSAGTILTPTRYVTGMTLGSYLQVLLRWERVPSHALLSYRLWTKCGSWVL